MRQVRQRDDFALLVADGDGVVVERDDARVGDGDAEYVSCEIAQHGVVTLPPMVDVDDPGLGPGGSGGDQVWARAASMAFSLPRTSLAKAM